MWQFADITRAAVRRPKIFRKLTFFKTELVNSISLAEEMIAIFFQSLHDMIKQMLNVISGNIYYNIPRGTN